MNIKVQREFTKAIKIGTGDAYIIVRDNPGLDFSAEIINACITNQAYDPQCEGSRADYLFRIIRKSPQKEKIISSVLKNLETEKSDYYGLDQMCDLAILFYKKGHNSAKDILYKRFEKNLLDNYENCGQYQIVEIEGLDGLLKVAAQRGRQIASDKNDWEDSWFVNDFQKKHKNLDVNKELEKAAGKNKYIKVYCKNIAEHKIDVKKNKKIKRFSYELMKEKIETKRHLFLSSPKVAELTDDEVIQLANDFLTEKDCSKQTLYLKIFKTIPFPFDWKLLLQIATQHKDKKLAEAALDALAKFKNKQIRELFIDKIYKRKNRFDYLILLVNNYQPEDYLLLFKIISGLKIDQLHQITENIFEIFESNKTKECKMPMELLYRKLNCGLCRNNIIKILNDNNVLSKEILSELTFDSNDKLRRFSRKKMKLLL